VGLGWVGSGCGKLTRRGGGFGRQADGDVGVEVDPVGEVGLAEELLEVLRAAAIDAEADGETVAGEADGLDEAVAFGGHGVGSLVQVCCIGLPMMGKISRLRCCTSAAGKKDVAYSNMWSRVTNKSRIRDPRAMNRCLGTFLMRSQFSCADRSIGAGDAPRDWFGGDR